jgi:hypothetical protein
LAQESDDSESEDDTFITVQPLGDNITRMYLHPLTTASSPSITLTCRQLRQTTLANIRIGTSPCD